MVKPLTSLRTISMTGFAARQGAGAGHSWTWDMRAVNGRGLDLRLRLPEIEGLEAPVRAAVAKAVSRGNITLSLRLTGAERGEGLRLSSPGLGAALVALREVEAAAQAAGLTLAPTRASDILALRSVTEQVLTESADMADLRALLLRDLDLLLREFAAMRQAEGAQIGAVVAAQVERIAELGEAALLAAEARRPEAQAALMAALGRVMGGRGRSRSAARRAGAGPARGEGRRDRGDRPAARPCRRGAGAAGGGGAGGPQARFPDPGIRARGQYAVLEIRLGPVDRDRA